ncbi:two-component sensor histidine kinase [Enterovibrio norvegicus FF-33]|uniref:histidine kinase n=1 Tax=Enterovibrio norvegicus FF-454 TaxID=1185651 RepID=A0A1E5C062_9GAMM|nr:cache domain-containing protein [Enterovibrio norvegicus]OEE58893.1 two-component sensor histidine kinase [Enterovibrio norvegicus FF-454]OEE67953.1 two-component sensor histidine kinase [Enterovibrio norvegicus FF-33]OEE75510.1 two-component sensor histidine kinase [Enterovibrio norvegicus FF-162]
MRVFKKWRQRFRTMVRYRLLVLTSVPIIITLLALIALTLYWTVAYSWKNALSGVKADLAVASNSMEVLQREQRSQLHAIADSYDFQTQIAADPAKILGWAQSRADKYGVDFLAVYPVSDIERLPLSLRQPLLHGQERTFFQVMSAIELASISPNLSAKAEIPLLQENTKESRGLISRSLLPLYNENDQLEWIIDGGILLNNSTDLVDKIRDLVFPVGKLPESSVGTVTLFMDDVRVSTNVPLDSENRFGRAIGTRVSDEVRDTVLIEGDEWVDRAYVYDAWYISAYKPIRDFNNKVIGMLYTGYLEWPLISRYLTNLIELGIGVLLTLLISGLLVYRGAKDLFRPIERIHRVVHLIRFDQDARIGKLGLDPQHELAILARQFDSMLDQLKKQNEEIRQNALELEDKVKERTASLHEKTEELKQNITLLEQTRNKLLLSEKLAALGELTAGIAHEINNPTAVILGNIELMEYELGQHADLVSEEMSTVLAQIDRIRNITRSLLQYSRQGGVQDTVTWQHVNPVIEESVTLVRSGTKRQDVEVVTELNAKCCVEINRHQLLQVLVNLQMNGIHAMNDKGKLIVRSEDWMDGSGMTIGAKISVQDFGCGIANENLTKIFDPFFTTRHTGTGLGLAVTQGIVSGLGGEIKVESDVGEGSVFTLYLREKIQQDDEITSFRVVE